jgi:RHS repeat-associated protein
MGAADKLYNGNIAETFWSTATDGGFVRNYGYKYDSLNRLKDATYQKSGQVTGMYNENLSYDKNGNIMNLSRYGDRDEQYLPIQIDNLGYNYGTNSNQLKSVTDATNNTSGFKDGITTGNDYEYDVNGNMTVDKNKNITAITYNHLNLPTKIIFPTGNIVYIYNASGQKVQKVVTENTTVTTTDYLRGYQYKNTVLQFFPTVEGYVKNTPVSGTNTYSYVFNYTDHLGNTRLSYTKDTTTGSLKILEENNYYPFGLKHSPYNSLTPAQEYKYKFQGQERQDELGLNWDSFKYRNYDYAIGRFMGIDPLAEKYSYQSPYNFSENQVIAYRELEGLEKIHYTYTFIKDQVSVNKTSINGPLGNGILVSSNHGGKMTYYYGNTIASSLVAFKKAYEGNNIDAKGNHVGYNDHLGNPTIGYGHKIVDGDTFTVGSKISEDKAQKLFASDSNWIMESADEYLENFDLNQNQTNALYDASFNMGPGKLSQYTEDGSKFSGGNFFLKFMGGGDGVKKRRYAENILYNQGISVHLDVLKGKSMTQIVDYLNSLIKKDEKKK